MDIPGRMLQLVLFLALFSELITNGVITKRSLDAWYPSVHIRSHHSQEWAFLGFFPLARVQLLPAEPQPCERHKATVYIAPATRRTSRPKLDAPPRIFRSPERIPPRWQLVCGSVEFQLAALLFLFLI